VLGRLVAGAGAGGEAGDAGQGLVEGGAAQLPTVIVLHPCHLGVRRLYHSGATNCAIYVRISFDWEGTGLGIERQLRDSLDLAETLGWHVGEIYRDNHISASGKKPRPEYLRMLAALEGGAHNALICYDLDRLTRSPVEVEHIIELAERKGISLATVGGNVNLSTPEGRLHARIKASVARHEIEQSSKRIRRKMQERAEKGLPHGAPGYGYRRVDGQDVLDPGEAAVVREIANRLLSGEGVKPVTDSLNSRGVPSPYGGEWSRVTVRHVVLRERNAGLRRHQGKVIGKADWPPIYDQETYHRLHALLGDPARKVTTGSAFRYLLSGIAKCGKCGQPVRVLITGRRRGQDVKRYAYVCGSCHGISRDQERVDQLITKLVTQRLAQPDARAIFSPEPDPLLIAEANRLRTKLEFVAGQFAKDQITGDQLTRITSTVRPRLQEIEAQLRPVVVDLADLATPDIAKRWDGIPLERRRAVVDFLLDVTLLPRGKDAPRRFDPGSIRVEWRRG
jgi:site-specific DNA recombinase